MTAATSRLRRRGIGAGVAALVGLTGLGFAAVPAQAAPGFDPTSSASRVAGIDRFETAAKAATAAFPGGSDTVIVANGYRSIDALSANYVAGVMDAPILLTDKDSVPTATSDAITALGATKVIVFGDENSVSAAGKAAMTAMGLTISDTIAGDDRYATAADAYTEGTMSKTVFIARGDFYGVDEVAADALAAGPLAYNGMPILLTAADELPESTEAALVAGGVTKVVYLGTGISDTVKASVLAAVPGVTTEQLGGADRTVTADMIAESSYGQALYGDTAAALANGYKVDALAAGPWAAINKTPILLTYGTTVLGDGTTKYLTDHADTLTSAYVFGDTASIAASATTAAKTAGGGDAAAGALAITPKDASTLTAANESGTTPTSDDRQYTVTGLTADSAYVVKLYPTDLLSTTGGATTFTDENSDNVADSDTVLADITVLNGAATTGDSQYRAVPVNGSISFTVDGNGFEDVTPVVYAAPATTTSFNLAVDDEGVPTVAYGVGGSVQFLAASGTNGGTATGAIEGANKTDKWISTAAASYKYDSNDKFYVVEPGGTVDATDQVSLADFEAVLTESGGDTLLAGTAGIPSLYLTTSSLQSTFIIENGAPVAPSLTDAVAANSVDASDTTAVVSVDSDTIIDGATVNVYIGDDSDSFDDATLVTSATTDSDSDTDGFQIPISGLTATTDYEVYLTQTVGGEESSANESTAGTATAFETTATPDSGLTVSSASITGDVNNGTGTSETFAVTFSKALTMNPTLAAGDVTVSPAGQSDYVIDAVSSTISTDGKTLTFTLDDALEDAGTDITYNVSIGAGVIASTTGPNASLKTTFKY